MQYLISFHLEGNVRIEAESEEEAQRKFYELSDHELFGECFAGGIVDDINED